MEDAHNGRLCRCRQPIDGPRKESSRSQDTRGFTHLDYNSYPEFVDGTCAALGITEVGLADIFYLSMWYPGSRRHMGRFWGGATFTGVFSGLLTFVISFMNEMKGFDRWPWTFVRICLRVRSSGIVVCSVHLSWRGS
ncbi:hypothetical protein C8Q80DRAFT_449462 [Daedaleopsis nitida]|nr:hypothetical protein C8Q80DRAFT_449462 [Daedaleopsis nitida]